ncbi:hypothetical protein ACIA8I_22565 [Streptomyces rishiriensis]|uniref:hypothetical protein n=1 Tax=Streptomyces rishiriensis TaxID=68264 RepID=UPI00379D7250
MVKRLCDTSAEAADLHDAPLLVRASATGGSTSNGATVSQWMGLNQSHQAWTIQ